MGFLFYGSNAYPVEVDDRALAHLKVAILTLLRANKSVAFGYERSVNAGSGRETLWISPSLELRFKFNGNRPAKINEAWVRAIIATSMTSTGLRLIPERSVLEHGDTVDAVTLHPVHHPHEDPTRVQVRT